jgi:hypothetical protein
VGNSRSIRRTDDQLMEMLDQSGVWIVHGSGDRILGAAATLRRALDRADNQTLSGAVIVAIARVPPSRVFIFQDQILRLCSLVQEEEVGLPLEVQ